MIADEIKKAGQATLNKCADLLTYSLTDTWETHSGDKNKLAALACDTGGTYWHDDDYSEWRITFTQDVCRYNGTPVKYYEYNVWGSGDGSAYEVTDFSGNQLYYSESTAPTASNFSIRKLEFQNGNQGFQLLNSEYPTYTDTYNDVTDYSESHLLNTQSVPSKSSATNGYSRYLRSIPGYTTTAIETVYAYQRYTMVMINAVTSSNYDWTGASRPNAAYDLNLTHSNLGVRSVRFNYYNPGNAMIMLRPGETLKIEVWTNVPRGSSSNVLITIERIYV